ncbi:MAG: hypothetical protein ACE5FW_01075 [Candidatus Aenigmatarchaeota archaeon]
MAEYNAPFFNALSTVFLTYKERHGEDQAVEFMREVFSRRLGPVYSGWGFTKGSPQDFARVVGKNDRLLGLEVEIELQEDRIVYRFKTDPFPGLKGQVDPRKFDDAYLAFKVSFLLGEGWSYTTPKHLWDGDPYTEHIIMKG